MYFIEHLLLVIGLCLATDTEESKDAILTLGEKEDELLIGVWKERTKHVEVLFDTICHYLTRYITISGNEDRELFKHGYEQNLREFQSKTQEYGEIMKKTMEKIAENHTLDLETVDFVHDNTIAYVSITEKMKNTLGNKLPLKDDVVEKFDKSAAALNEKPDLSKVFSSGNKVIKIGKKSNVDLLCEDTIKLYTKIEKFFVEKIVERVEQNKAQIEISDEIEANQKTSTANPDQQ